MKKKTGPHEKQELSRNIIMRGNSRKRKSLTAKTGSKSTLHDTHHTKKQSKKIVSREHAKGLTASHTTRSVQGSHRPQRLSHTAHRQNSLSIQMRPSRGWVRSSTREEKRNRKLAARMHQQEVIAYLSQVALASVDLDLDSFMNEVSIFVARTLDVEYAKILELEEGGETLLLRAGYGWRKNMVPGKTRFASKSSIGGYTLISKRPIVIKNLELEKDFYGVPHLRANNVASGISVIIHGVPHPYGVIGTYSRSLKNFTPDDVNFLQSVANILALIFERTRTENELKRFQYMADNANIGISLIDKNGNFKYVNKITYERLGYTREEYLRKRVVYRPSADALPEFGNIFKQAQKGDVKPFETVEMMKGGAFELPIEINLTGVTFGGEQYLFAVTQDISERIRAQEERVRAQGNLEFLARSGLILGSSLNYRETLDLVAKAAVSYIADWCTVEMLDENGVPQLLAIAHKDPKKMASALKTRRSQASRTNSHIGVLNVLRTGRAELHKEITDEFLVKNLRDENDLLAAREIGPRSAMIVPICAGRKPIGVITFVTAETNRRYTADDLSIAQELAVRAALAIENSKLYSEIEEQKGRLDTTIKNVPGIVWENWMPSKNSKRKVDFVSDYAQAMTGYSSEEWKSDGFMRKIMHPEDFERLVVEYDEMIKEKKGGVLHFRLRHKNGRQIWIESHNSVILDSKGDVLGLRGVMMDVSERVEHEQRKDEFISMASHELKTPVTTLKVFTQILEKQSRHAGDRSAAAYLTKMDGQITRLTDLINDLLDLSKIQSGKLSFKYSTFKMDKLVREVIEQLQPTSDTHTIHVSGATKSSITADRDRIGQVIINLVTNAIKYSPGADRINVMISEENGTVKVGVEDYGIGISEEQRTRIFERFYQGSEGAQKTFPGLGIGLYISDQIMQRHGGSITVESDRGKWSLFTMILPTKSARRETPILNS